MQTNNQKIITSRGRVYSDKGTFLKAMSAPEATNGAAEALALRFAREAVIQTANFEAACLDSQTVFIDLVSVAYAMKGGE